MELQRKSCHPCRLEGNIFQRGGHRKPHRQDAYAYHLALCGSFQYARLYFPNLPQVEFLHSPCEWVRHDQLSTRPKRTDCTLANKYREVVLGDSPAHRERCPSSRSQTYRCVDPPIFWLHRDRGQSDRPYLPDHHRHTSIDSAPNYGDSAFNSTFGFGPRRPGLKTRPLAFSSCSTKASPPRGRPIVSARLSRWDSTSSSPASIMPAKSG